MAASRFFRRLLRLLPFDFRADYGREMEQVFGEQHREARGRLARARVCWHALRGLLAVGPREHARQLRQDVVYAVRGMRQAPGFVAVALMTLALGIGTNTAMFSVVHAVLLRPLPYGDPDRLVAVSNRWTGTARAGLSDPEYLDYFERARTLTLAAAAIVPANLTGGTADPERVQAAAVSTNTLDVLAVHPAIGRGFEPDEEQTGRDRVSVLTDALWRRRFAADPSIVGRTIAVDGDRYEVLGVMPPGFRLPSDFGSTQQVELLLPLPLNRSSARDRRGGHYLQAFGRLRSGATVEAAAADMTRVITGLMREYPDQHTQGQWGIVVEPLRSDLLGPARPVLFTLLGAVGFVLLIACANVANLQLARGEARRRELAVRTALGASRLRLARQLLTESAVLSVAGAALGLLVAVWCRRLVLAIDPSTLPRVADMTLDVPVLAFTAGLAITTGLVFGLMPALQVSRVSISDAIASGGRGSAGGTRARVRAALVVGQVGVAVVLLVGAGLLTRSFVNLTRVPSGLDAEGVLTLRVSPPPARYASQHDVNAFFSAFLVRVRALPGVGVAGAATGLPLAVASGDWSFDVEGRPLEGRRHSAAADWFAVTPGYFESLRIQLVEGRLPGSTDREAAAPAIFLNQAAARQVFPGGRAIGQRLRLSGPDQPWRTIAGIVGDVHHRGLDRPVRPEMFIPLDQFKHFSVAQARSLTLVIRTTLDPLALAGPVRASLRAIDPEVPASQVRDMEEVVSRSVADRRLNTVLMGAFGALALALAAIGLYGVMAYQVLQRTREMGVRLALGASPDSVLRLVVSQGMRLVAAGLALGIAAAAALGGWMRTLLYEVPPSDGPTLAGVALLLMAVGGVACLMPARRATRVDPLVALRAE
jgi:putative ABC transport system permease protein